MTALLRRTATWTPVVLVVLVLSAACADGEPDTSTTTAGVVSPEALSEYADIAALHTRLLDEGVECVLEYEGLEDEGKEVSICVIEGEQALLTIWSDPALVLEFASSDTGRTETVAVGRNWTVDVDTGETARLLADALGGVLPADLAG